NYKFSDNDLNPGIYKYRLKQKDFNGNFEYFYLNNEVNVLPPAKFSLSQNFPNPFNPKTVISYKLATGSFIKVDVFDILGNKVKNLVNADQIAGSYSVEFDGSDLASGNYFYKLQSEKFTEIKRMTLIK
ncbi:MAG TPA: T9SS type A sorting domain-containing protein, partial [Ignavibacteria bacterium]|nr:T9SS type A sorting domain-containing protein [Ignavibacteria bacterium]